MNFATFAGRLGRDAELRAGPNNDPVLNFSLAVNVGFGDKQRTLWVDCHKWGQSAEKLAPYMLKGKAVTVAGDVDLREFQKRDGTHGAAITCNVQRLTLQSSKDDGERREPAEPRPQQQRARNPEPRQETAEVGAGAQPDFDDFDQIPF